MIGLGKWKCEIRHTLFDGTAYLIVDNKDGEYCFDVIIEGANTPEFVSVKTEENGNTLSGVVKVKSLPIKLNYTATFNGDKMSGVIDIPFVGKIEVKDAVRV